MAERNCSHPCSGPVCRRPRKKTIRKPIRKFSKKRGKENRKYSALRKQELKVGDECEAKLPGCTFFATELHHPAGRTGKKLTDVKKCKKVCRSCHVAIEKNPAASKELGLSESRLNPVLKQ
jgi:hypothetical protein